MVDIERVKRFRNNELPRRSVAWSRVRAHEVFDRLWRDGWMQRSQAYAWLAARFGKDEIHIAWLGIEDCERVVRYVNEWFEEEEDGMSVGRGV